MALDSALYGMLMLLVVDGLWVTFAIPRIYTSLTRNTTSNKITRIIKGNRLEAQDTAGEQTFSEMPTVANPLLRALLFILNVIIGPLILAYMIDCGISGARAGALLGFYAYYVFNATTLSVSSYNVRDAVYDTLYGTALFTVLGTVIEDAQS